MTKILLVHIDGRMPNLALMKLSAHHKSLGDEVGFNTADPDIVYISVIFKKNFTQAQGVMTWYPLSKCYIGGPGADDPSSLSIISPEIDGLMPDYDLYDTNYSMGFTKRGCIRKCGFCIVPEIEGDIKEATPIESFHHPDHKKVLLMDNNLLASPTWKRTLNYIIEKGLKVNFSQGLDIRLITKESAEMLFKVKAVTGVSNRRMYHFAWDNVETEKAVFRGISLLFKAGIKPDYLTFYILTRFDTTHKEDLYRVEKLREIGVNPYIMIYEGDRSDPFINYLRRWVNAKIHKTCEFRDYSRLTAKVRQELKHLEMKT